MEDRMIEYLKDIKIQQYKSDIGFKTLMEGVNDNLYVIPKYQRQYKWNENQLEALVQSLIREFPIPPIYTYRNKNNRLEILDGQQRILSLFFYYIGKYINPKKSSTVDYRKLDIDGRSFQEALEEAYDLIPLHTSLKIDDETEVDISYANLPEEIRLSLDYVTLTVIEIRWINEDKRAETVQQIFENLNRGGVRLEKQEVRNGVYGCKFYDMLHNFNCENQSWRNIWGKEDSNSKDVEMLLKLCAWRKYVQYEGGEFKFENFKGRSDYMLDEFSEYVMNLDKEENIIDEYKQSLEQFLQVLPDGYKIKKLNLLESIYLVLEKTELRVILTKEVLEEILNSESYKKNSSQGTFSKKRMNERWKGVYDILSKYSE